MERTIIFNHIPRTGGTTLRVILNKVYGEDRVYFINSRDIPSSLERYKSLDEEGRRRYKVISGHGANEYAELLDRPFMITILREPVSLFTSQYTYLRKSRHSNFLDDVSKLQSLDQYIDYALEHGQDNMMTRLLDPSNKQLYTPGNPPAGMAEAGDKMLNNALNQFSKYDAILRLSDFDRGIYSLARVLSWKRIPLYRPLNKSVRDTMVMNDDAALRDRIIAVLRYDIELYRVFLQSNLRISERSLAGRLGAALFGGRQKIISMAGKIIKQNLPEQEEQQPQGDAQQKSVK